MTMIAEAEKEEEDEKLEEDRIDKKERLKRQLPEEVNGIPTPTFDYKAERPPANPELIIWAYMNALKKYSYKGLKHIKFDNNELPEEPNMLFLRKKKGKNPGAEYILNFSQQNADAMLRHMPVMVLLPIAILRICMRAALTASGTIRDRAAAISSVSLPKKRKAESDAISVSSGSSSSSSNSKEDLIDMFEDFNRKQYLKLS
ncbi:hypothetical protein LZL87_014380 [Fusarium oxysporum]|nr:hypothetical protein LZL87_014380 [Fusarium oxysporum]